MIWSQPAVTNPQSSPLESLHASTSWSSGSSNTSPSLALTTTSPSDESAAALLLNLGQEPRIRLASRGHGTSPQTLNMERLWAGDLTQLPANQQLHALNLSQQQAAAAAAAATAQHIMYLGKLGCTS